MSLAHVGAFTEPPVGTHILFKQVQIRFHAERIMNAITAHRECGRVNKQSSANSNPTRRHLRPPP